MKKLILALAFFIMSCANVEAAEIDSALYFGNPDVIYPLVILDDDQVALKINKEIRAEVKRLVDTVSENMIEGNFNSVVLEIDYRIPCNHENGLLSIILEQFVNYENSAHPSRYYRTLNFNSSTGERIWASSLTELGKPVNGEDFYSPGNITRRLRAYVEKNNIHLFQDFQRLTAVPEEFYFDDATSVHFIFQQGEIAASAVGAIDFNAGIEAE